MINLAVNLSMIFTEVPLLERFALAKQHGFSHVEIQFPYELSIQTIEQQLGLHDLSLCLINVPAGDLMQGGNGLTGIAGKEDEFHQAVKLALEYATALKVPSVNILAGKQPKNTDLHTCLNTLNNNLKFASEILSKHDIQPVFEMINGTDMPRFLVQDIVQAQTTLDAVQHPALKIQFDCYHMTMMGENVLAALKENIDSIGHIQFADYPNRHEPNTGIINYTEIFEWLKQSNYTGFTSAEYHPLNGSNNSFAWKSHFFA